MNAATTTPSPQIICERLKKFGFGDHCRIRLYGNYFEVVSDPFPDGDGFAIRVRSQKESNLRNVSLPRLLVEMARRDSGLSRPSEAMAREAA